MPDPQLAMGDQRKGSGNVSRAKSMPLSLLERGLENGDSCSRSPSPPTERCPSILPSETARQRKPSQDVLCQLPPFPFGLVVAAFHHNQALSGPEASRVYILLLLLTTAKEMEEKLAFPSVGCWGPINPMGVVCHCCRVPFPKCMTQNLK